MTMGKYLDILKSGKRDGSDISDISDIRSSQDDACADFGRFRRFGRTSQRFCEATYTALERRCPDYVDRERWQQAIADGRHFLDQWGDQAAVLGWTARDLFGLADVPGRLGPNYQRLSRYDLTGLVWLLNGGQVVALTAETARIQSAGGTVSYPRHNKPALGPVGDCLDDFISSKVDHT
jgi:hypothetical protein